MTSYEQLEEVKRVSRYPKLKALIPAHVIGAMVNNLHRAHVLDQLTVLGEIEIEDPEDVFLVAQAVQGQADYLVTGDHRSGLLKRRTINSIRIVTPSEFCCNLLKK